MVQSKFLEYSGKSVFCGLARRLFREVWKNRRSRRTCMK